MLRRSFLGGIDTLCRKWLVRRGWRCWKTYPVPGEREALRSWPVRPFDPVCKTTVEKAEMWEEAKMLCECIRLNFAKDWKPHEPNWQTVQTLLHVGCRSLPPLESIDLGLAYQLLKVAYTFNDSVEARAMLRTREDIEKETAERLPGQGIYE